MSNPLFPVPFKTAFTTSSAPISHLAHVVHLKLEDDDLGVHKESHRTTHHLVAPPSPVSHSHDSLPAPTHAWEAVYPKGSVNPSGKIVGGFSFYISPPSFVEQLKHARNVVVSYRVLLDKDWAWVKGGKLPGVFGGIGELAYGCTGGRQADRESCFDVRVMWRGDGSGELYTYIPPTEHNTARQRKCPPKTIINNDYGSSVGRGSFKFQKGVWTTIAIQTKMNSVGKEDGELRLFIDGKEVIHIQQLELRKSNEAQIKGLHFQTFFGGHGDDWAPSKDVHAYFADISASIIE